MVRSGVLVFVLGLGLAACGGHQPAAQAPQAPHSEGIEWPSALDHPSTPETKHAAALLMLDASGMKDTLDGLIDVSLDQQIKLHPDISAYRDVMSKFLRKYLNYPALRDELASAFEQQFDELQLRQIAAFYATPTGQVAVKKLPEMMRLGGEIGSRRVAAHQQELMEALQKAIQERPQGQVPPST